MAQEVTVTEAVKLLGRSKRTVERYIKAGRLEVAYEPDGRRIVTVPDDMLAEAKRRMAHDNGRHAVTVIADGAAAQCAELERECAQLRERLAEVTTERDYLRDTLLASLEATRRLLVSHTTETSDRQVTGGAPARPAIRLSPWSRIQQWWTARVAS